MEEKHNGWTNYATWRVALEMFDGYTAEDLDPHTKIATREGCQEYVEQYLEDCTSGCNIDSQIISGWANAFLAKVNWQEIAEHLNNEE
jgi:hypothetical protein